MSSLTTAVAPRRFLRLEVQSWPCLFHTFHQVRLKPSSSLLRLTRPPAAVGQHATVVLWIPATCRAMTTRHILLLCILGAALLSSVSCRSKDTSGHLFVVISLFLNWVCGEKLDCLCLQMRSALTTVASTSTRDRWTKNMSAPITWRIVDAPKVQSCEWNCAQLWFHLFIYLYIILNLIHLYFSFDHTVYDYIIMIMFSSLS